MRHRARPTFEPLFLQTIVAIAREDEAIWFGKVTRVLSASVQVQQYEETGNKGQLYLSNNFDTINFKFIIQKDIHIPENDILSKAVKQKLQQSLETWLA